VANGLERRLEKLEQVAGVTGLDDLIVDAVVDSRRIDLGFRFAYVFAKNGDITGIRYAGRGYARRTGESLGDFRQRAISGPAITRIYRELLSEVAGSRGLPYKHARDWRADDAAREARVTADERRRRGETTTGERAITFLELTVAR
jgi:hypothetical protein